MISLNFKEFIRPQPEIKRGAGRLISIKDWYLEMAERQPNCPKCGSPLVLRKNNKTGAQFYGCSQFPRCNGTLGYKAEPTAAPVKSAPKPPPTSAPVATPTVQNSSHSWVYAKVTKNGDPRFGVGQEIAAQKQSDGNWSYLNLKTGNKGIIHAYELQSTIQSIKNQEGKPIWTDNPSLQDFYEKTGQDSPAKPEEVFTPTEEQDSIKRRFAEMMANPDQSHMMISALAGTGKTTTLKELAKEFGKPDQRWLYLVFNTKNKVEATEKFPKFVQVRTTNGFLGEVLKDKKNFSKIPQTERIAQLNKFKGNGDEDGGGKLEKARLIADGPDFAKIMEKNGISDRQAPASIGKLAKTINSILKSIRYQFKEQVLTLAGLAKSFAIDPRKHPEMIEEGIKKILDSYDFDTELSEVKERIAKYSGSYRANVLYELEDILGYNFMDHDYTDGIKDAAKWLLIKSMPNATNQMYRHGPIDHNLGEFRDFNDDLWYAAVHGDEIHWPHYDVVMADEVQDFNEAQKIMLKKLHDAGAKIVAVGDANQCHPAGTKISTNNGDQLIEEIKIGQEVVTYNTKKSYFPGTKTQGRKVLNKSVRPYKGQMITIKAGDYSLKCTPNHKCLVKFNNGGKDKYALYLMIKDHHARIGMCRLNYMNGFGVSIRAKQEDAQSAYLLEIYDTERDARIAEVVSAYKFNIPQLMFKNNGKCSADQLFINEVYEQIGDNLHNAQKCVESFGRDWEFPIWTKEKQERFGKLCQNYVGSSKSFITQACNLISNHMVVRTFDGSNRGGEWMPIEVEKEYVECDVYSLEVEPTEGGRKLYVANNIVTHNSIYRFRGADGRAFNNIADLLTKLSSDKDVTKTLTKNFRSLPELLDFANQETHVKNLVAGKKANGEKGVVTKGDVGYNKAFDQLSQEKNANKIKETAFISRTNEPLVHAALQLLTKNIPFVILGKDIAKDLKKHIRKITGRFNLSDMDSTYDLQEKLEEFRSGESETHHGKAVKKAYLQELDEVTEAMLSAVGQFQAENTANGGNIGQFNKWISQRLGGLDVEESEEDLKAYQEKMKKEKPVVLTTAHRSKGLEFDRCYILRYDLFPHKKAVRPEDLAQEDNARYVALTRGKKEMHVLKLDGQPGYKK